MYCNSFCSYITRLAQKISSLSHIVSCDLKKKEKRDVIYMTANSEDIVKFYQTYM